jgi:hypothetical protein
MIHTQCTNCAIICADADCRRAFCGDGGEFKINDWIAFKEVNCGKCSRTACSNQVISHDL